MSPLVVCLRLSALLPGLLDVLLVCGSGENAPVAFSPGVGGHPLHLHLCHWENSRGMWNRSARLFRRMIPCLFDLKMVNMIHLFICQQDIGSSFRYQFLSILLSFKLSNPETVNWLIFLSLICLLLFFPPDVHVWSGQNKPKGKGVVQWLF